MKFLFVLTQLGAAVVQEHS